MIYSSQVHLDKRLFGTLAVDVYRFGYQFLARPTFSGDQYGSMNAIACGVIDTSMNDQLTPEERKALEDEIPAGRYGTPKEIAQMVWNIVHAPEYMTGQIIGVDGGFL